MIKIEDINLLEQGYKLVFDLRSSSSILVDENYIKNIQQTALLHKDLKVKTSHIYSNLSDNSGMW
ncbi:hypothetical protein, partial [Acinetobacter baumannii]|uniref:hypothetical protein n=1 Tax=Acinetobacter baumannii TaxID=470 RepID=UPI001FF2A49D